MTHTPPLPDAATSPYPVEEPPHDHPAGPNGEPIRFAANDSDAPIRLTTEAKALLGVAAALAIGAIAALTSTLFRKRPEPKPAPAKRTATRKPAARKTAARKPAARRTPPPPDPFPAGRWTSRRPAGIRRA